MGFLNPLLHPSVKGIDTPSRSGVTLDEERIRFRQWHLSMVGVTMSSRW